MSGAQLAPQRGLEQVTSLGLSTTDPGQASTWRTAAQHLIQLRQVGLDAQCFAD